MAGVVFENVQGKLKSIPADRIFRMAEQSTLMNIPAKGNLRSFYPRNFSVLRDPAEDS